MLVEKLRQYKESGKMIGYCCWSDGEGLLLGRVVEVSDSEVVFADYDPLGRPKGEHRRPIESIYSVTELDDYVERLRLFAEHAQDVDPKAKGQTTKAQKQIRKFLKEAKVSGECLSIKVAGDDEYDHRVVEVASEACQLEEFGDDPLKPRLMKVVRYELVESIRRRASGELAVTALWAWAKTQS